MEEEGEKNLALVKYTLYGVASYTFYFYRFIQTQKINELRTRSEAASKPLHDLDSDVEFDGRILHDNMARLQKLLCTTKMTTTQATGIEQEVSMELQYIIKYEKIHLFTILSSICITIDCFVPSSFFSHRVQRKKRAASLCQPHVTVFCPAAPLHLRNPHHLLAHQGRVIKVSELEFLIHLRLPPLRRRKPRK